jgi:flagellin-like protein
MNIRDLLSDERAVSPVIGVILMVAITVILAAVIGTFVLGLGDQLSSSSPSASFGFDYEINESATEATAGRVGNLTVSHNGGDKIEASNVNVTADADIGYWHSNGTYVAGKPANSSISFADMGEGDGQIGAGTSVKVSGAEADGIGYANANNELESSTVRVVWSTPNSDSTAQLGKWDGPDA